MSRQSQSQPQDVHVFTDAVFIRKGFKKAKNKKLNFIIIEVPKDYKSLMTNTVYLLQEADILVCDTNWMARLLYCLPNLKWAQCVHTTVEEIGEFIDENELPTFKLTRGTNNKVGALVAEYVLGQIISSERKLPLCHANQNISTWASKIIEGKKGSRIFRSLGELRISILGLGTVGAEVARLLKHWETTVFGLCKNKKTSEEMCQYVDFTFTSIEDTIKDCDYIINLLPCTPATKNILTLDILSTCTNCPLYINVSKSRAIGEDDLIEALNKGYLRGAVLDLFDKEPLYSKSPLWAHPKVVVTPHVSAPERNIEVVDIFLENYELYKRGENLLYQYDWNELY